MAKSFLSAMPFSYAREQASEFSPVNPGTSALVSGAVPGPSLGGVEGLDCMIFGIPQGGRVQKKPVFGVVPKNRPGKMVGVVPDRDFLARTCVARQGKKATVRSIVKDAGRLLYLEPWDERVYVHELKALHHIQGALLVLLEMR